MSFLVYVLSVNFCFFYFPYCFCNKPFSHLEFCSPLFLLPLLISRVEVFTFLLVLHVL